MKRYGNVYGRGGVIKNIRTRHLKCLEYIKYHNNISKNHLDQNEKGKKKNKNVHNIER